jgi:hypothetical protein
MTVKLDEIDIRRNCNSMIKTGEEKKIDDSYAVEEIIIGKQQHLRAPRKWQNEQTTF